MYREDDAALIAVVEAVFVISCEADFYQQVFVVAMLCCVLGEGRAAVWTVAELEAVDDGIAEAALVEVGEADRLSFVGCHHCVGEVLLCEAVDVEHTFALILCRQLFGCLLTFFDFDTIFLGEITESLRI